MHMTQNRYWIHWWVALGLLFVTAILCGMMQNLWGYDVSGQLFFIFISVVGLFFSSVFAWLQLETKNSYLTTFIFVGCLSIYLMLLSYLYHDLPRGEGVEFSLFQKLIDSDLTFWCGFLLPFIFSLFNYAVLRPTKF